MTDKTGREEDARIVYADIIDMPHWTSPTRNHMSLYDRAAQFAPFAALSGYDDMVNEEARFVDNRIELDESEIENLNRKLELIAQAIRDGYSPVVTVTFFVKDRFKAGGSYRTLTETVRKVDSQEHKLIFEKKTHNPDTDASAEYHKPDASEESEITRESVDFADILELSGSLNGHEF